MIRKRSTDLERSVRKLLNQDPFVLKQLSWLDCFPMMTHCLRYKNVSEYDQEISQSHTNPNPEHPEEEQLNSYGNKTYEKQ